LGGISGKGDSGFFAGLQGDIKNRQRQEQQQIPFGDDNKKGKCNYKTKCGDLSTAAHDETVNRFGRDDDVDWVVE
jgi:hypothetical protein